MPLRRPLFRLQSQAASTAVSYALFAALWIIFSDRILNALVSDHDTLSLLQTVKGGVFIAVTAALVYVLVHRQVARLLTTEEDLQASEERYREVVEGTDDLITQIDREGRFTFVNHRALRYLGLNPVDCLGLSAFDFVHPNDRERSREWLQHCLQNHRYSESIENRQVSRTGESTAMLWTVNFRYQPDGSLESIRSIGRDISERKAVEQALQDHLRMRSEFISTAAHELRTPLAAIQGYAELLLSDHGAVNFAPDKQREFIAIIHNRAEALSRIIDELLDLSRIEAGQKIRLELRPCNLAEVITTVVADFQTRFPDRSFELRLSPDCRHLCWGDPGRMRQVMENLLDNAVKYAPAGVITAGCSPGSGHCRISVSDQGIGMSPQQTERVFDQFYRADASNTAVSGLGLGLSIVRHIVEGHGGRIEVDSELGQGTTLTVILPQRREEEDAVPQADV